MPQFEIEVGGNIAPVTKSLAELKSRLKELKFEIEKSTDAAGLAVLNRELRETEQEIKRIKNIGPIISPNAAKGVNQAATAVANMSKIAQDAPFGFIGIQNNLNPLLESFQRLRVETGSNGAALKALTQSLVGSAGIGLALSVVSSLVTAVIQKYGSLGNAMDALFGTVTVAAQAQRDLNAALAENGSKAAGEIAGLQALLTVARDETLTKNARLEAINKINKEYEKYLPNLTLENVNTDKVREAVDKLTSSLVRQAQIRGLQDLISKETAKQAELLTNDLSENADAWDNIVAAVKSLKTGGNFFNEQLIAGAKTTGKEYEKARNRIEVFKKALVELTRAEAINDTLFTGTDKKEDALKKRLAVLEKIKKSTQDAGRLSELQEAIFDLQVKIAIRDDKSRLDPREFEELIDGFKKELQAAFLKHAISLEAIPKVKFSPVSMAEIPKVIDSIVSRATGNEKITITLHDVRLRLLGSKKTKIIEGTEEINKQLSEEIQDSLANLQLDLAGSFGDALGEAFATAIQGGDLAEGLKNAAKAMLGILGSVMQQIGRYVIGAAIKIQALKKTLETFAIKNPALAVLAGVGLIAAGAALKNATFQGPKFAKGGIVTGPTIGMVGEAGKEAIIPLNKLGSMIGSPGGTTVVLKGSLGIRGRELVAFLEQEKERFNRIR